MTDTAGIPPIDVLKAREEASVNWPTPPGVSEQVEILARHIYSGTPRGWTATEEHVRQVWRDRARDGLAALDRGGWILVRADERERIEREAANDALDRLASKAASDRQWEDGMGNAHAWLRQLVQDVREELAGGDSS